MAVGVVVVGPELAADKRAPLRFDFDLERRSAGTSRISCAATAATASALSLAFNSALPSCTQVPARLDDGIHGVVERRLEAVLLQVRLDHHALGFEVLVAHDTAAF